jgi:hypothetical protein
MLHIDKWIKNRERLDKKSRPANRKISRKKSATQSFTNFGKMIVIVKKKSRTLGNKSIGEP